MKSVARACRAPLIALAALLGACAPGGTAPPPPLPRLALEPSELTVSGLSAGGYMATQFHVSFSALVRGAGIFAAGPWDCAEGSLSRALAECLGQSFGTLDVGRLVSAARQAASDGRVDPLAGLGSARVFVLRGTRDDRIARPVSDALVDFYKAFVPATQVHYVTDVAVAHGVPTVDAGGDCGTTASPYLNACGYDGVGAMLTELYPSLAHPAASAHGVPGGLRRFAQSGYDPTGSLAATGFVYVPARCATGAHCRLHVAFHGCRQGEEFVGESFARDAGYNAWAEANDLVVLYPQARRSAFVPLNAEGCFDWWGYTGADYATRRGQQVDAVRRMVRALGGF
jgi:poly(3-hydroxybutyrate) depolymerase